VGAEGGTAIPCSYPEKQTDVIRIASRYYKTGWYYNQQQYSNRGAVIGSHTA
jgi:hypothetical protein